jgi:hypothetical protein
MPRFNLNDLVQEPETQEVAQQDVTMDLLQPSDMELSIFRPAKSLEPQAPRQYINEPLLARSQNLLPPLPYTPRTHGRCLGLQLRM